MIRARDATFGNQRFVVLGDGCRLDLFLCQGPSTSLLLTWDLEEQLLDFDIHVNQLIGIPGGFLSVLSLTADGEVVAFGIDVKEGRITDRTVLMEYDGLILSGSLRFLPTHPSSESAVTMAVMIIHRDYFIISHSPSTATQSKTHFTDISRLTIGFPDDNPLKAFKSSAQEVLHIVPISTSSLLVTNKNVWGYVVLQWLELDIRKKHREGGQAEYTALLCWEMQSTAQELSVVVCHTAQCVGIAYGNKLKFCNAGGVISSVELEYLEENELVSSVAVISTRGRQATLAKESEAEGDFDDSDDDDEEEPVKPLLILLTTTMGESFLLAVDIARERIESYTPLRILSPCPQGPGILVPLIEQLLVYSFCIKCFNLLEQFFCVSQRLNLTTHCSFYVGASN